MDKVGVLIVGGGNAGFQVADSLRKGGYGDPITILADENTLPYQRPPLSKKYLAGELAAARLLLRPAQYFDDKNINVVQNCCVMRIHSEENRVETTDGRSFDYEHLVLATGAQVRKLPVDDKLGLLYLRSKDDVETINERIKGVEKITLIGGGFIGLEVAATLSGLDKAVTVIEAAPTIMPNLVAPIVADYFSRYHQKNDVEIISNAKVESITGSATEGYKLTLDNGASHNADVVIVGIGVTPNTGLAEDIGLVVDGGIMVDEYGRTNQPNIFAAGDCACGLNTWIGRRVHIQSVQNAVDQATVVAKTILGDRVPYQSVPWFWSDQYDLKLQMAGLSYGFDDYVVRGALDDDKFSICYFKQGALLAMDSINRPADHLAARKLLTAKAAISKAECEDIETPLKTFLKT